MSRKQKKYIHEGGYVAEVEIELQDSNTGWTPTMSLDDAYKLDDVRESLHQGDVVTASKNSIVYEMKRVAFWIVKMRIAYYEEEDTLYIEFTKEQIVRDESVNWNINIGYTENRIGEMTILEAQKSGIYPMQVEKIVSEAA